MRLVNPGRPARGSWLIHPTRAGLTAGLVHRAPAQSVESEIQRRDSPWGDLDAFSGHLSLFYQGRLGTLAPLRPSVPPGPPACLLYLDYVRHFVSVIAINPQMTAARHAWTTPGPSPALTGPPAPAGS